MRPRYGWVLGGAFLVSFIIPTWQVRSNEVVRPIDVVEDGPDYHVLLDEASLFFGVDAKSGKPFARRDTRRKIHILRESAVGQARRVVGYQRGVSTVTGIEGHTTLPDGRIIPLETASIRDVSEWSSTELYTDQRQKRFDLPLPCKGAVIEWRYTEHWTDVNRYWGWVLASSKPADLVRYRVVAPGDATVEYVVSKANEVVEVAPVETVLEGGKRELLWEAREVPGGPYESDSPSWELLRPRVLVRLASIRTPGGQQTWGRMPIDVARTFAEPYRERMTESPEMHRLVAEVMSAAGHPDSSFAKARVLYQWVQDHIRYVAVEVGEGRVIPHPADQTLKVRYGDCKDKATLLATLLRIAGVDSVPVLVRTRTGFPLRVQWPMINAFNHVILEIRTDRGPVLADPTSDFVPLGSLPSSDQNVEMLVLDPEDPRFFVSPQSLPQNNLSELRFDVRVDESGVLSGTFRLSFTGTHAWDIRSSLLTRIPKARRDYLSRLLALNVRELQILHHEIQDPFGRAEPLVISGSFRARSPVAFHHDLAVIRPATLIGSQEFSRTEETRNWPFVRTRNSMRDVEARIRLPRPISSLEGSSGGAEEGVTGTYEWSTSLDNGALVLSRRSTYRSVWVDVEDFPSRIRDFFRSLARADLPVLLRLAQGGGR